MLTESDIEYKKKKKSNEIFKLSIFRKYVEWKKAMGYIAYDSPELPEDVRIRHLKEVMIEHYKKGFILKKEFKEWFNEYNIEKWLKEEKWLEKPNYFSEEEIIDLKNESGDSSE